jgi:2-keto-3-deoxy-L-rhamnonate aldolase RhmA
MANKLRQACLDRAISLGTWMQIGHPAPAEVFAGAGFDWVAVDLEHGIIDLESTGAIFRALSAFDCTPVARLPLNDPIWIHRTLDAGAQGLIIPMVKTAEEAEAAIAAAKYPPRGERGYGYSRANLHGINFSAYAESANDDVAMIMQIEHKDAIPNLDAILAVDGVDALFIGPYDLSGSMGMPGNFEAPEMKAALDEYLAACGRAGKSAGTHIVRPTDQNIRASVEDGYTLMALGLDTVFIEEGSRAALRAARGG